MEVNVPKEKTSNHRICFSNINQSIHCSLTSIGTAMCESCVHGASPSRFPRWGSGKNVNQAPLKGADACSTAHSKL
eukprot:492159-Amphidinium_carterae.1